MSAQAQIADRRFQHYEGERRGAGYSFVSLLLHSIGWVLGHKRSSRYKIIPALVLGLVFMVAAGFVLVVTVAPPGTPLPAYPISSYSPCRWSTCSLRSRCRSSSAPTGATARCACT